MIIIPAIDLSNGKCVRLTQGKASRKKIYSNNPVAIAKQFVKAGIQRLHVIDLDGAFLGEPKNLEWVLRIKKETGVFVQLGGGLRTLDVIEKVLEAGVDRAILGTILFSNEKLVKTAFKTFGKRLMVAMDVKNDIVVTHGWTKSSNVLLSDALEKIEGFGGKEIIFTDISRDGMLKGVNFKSIEKVMALTPLTVFASGGVTSLEDVKKLAQVNSPGCVVGKALYEGKLNLKDAIKAASAAIKPGLKK